MKEYRINYSTRYQAKCSNRVWKDFPEGLQYARLGHIIKDREKKRTVVSVTAFCIVDGKAIRKTKNVPINSKDVRNVRLRLVEVPDTTGE